MTDAPNPGSQEARDQALAIIVGRLQGALDIVGDEERFPEINRAGLAEILAEAISVFRPVLAQEDAVLQVVRWCEELRKTQRRRSSRLLIDSILARLRHEQYKAAHGEEK